MKRLSFTRGVVAAALLAVGAAATFAASTLLWPGTLVLKSLVTALSAAYMLILIAHAGLRSGRITLPVLWLSGALAIAAWSPGIGGHLIAHALLLWLIRSFSYHTSVLSALGDLGLGAFAVVAACASAAQSASVALSVWCFFLVQALFVFIPRSWNAAKNAESTANQRFDHAYRQAEAALRRLRPPA